MKGIVEMFNYYGGYIHPFWFMNQMWYHQSRMNQMWYPQSRMEHEPIKDYGPKPYVVDIEKVTEENTNYRTALWTGPNLQVTLMSIDVDDDIGLEVHDNVDQFIRIEEGQGLVLMGKEKNQLDYQQRVRDDFAIMVPAGTWHNVVNTGSKPLKLYAIYAPPEHPQGTVHETKAIAEAMESNH